MPSESMSLLKKKSIGGGNVADKQVPWWTLHEVADELNITEGTSKSTYHRAKGSIRKILINR